MSSTGLATFEPCSLKRITSAASADWEHFLPLAEECIRGKEDGTIAAIELGVDFLRETSAQEIDFHQHAGLHF